MEEPYDTLTEAARYLQFLDKETSLLHGQSKTSEHIYTPRSLLVRYFADEGGSIDRLLHEVLEQDEAHVFPASSTILEQFLGILTVLLKIGQARYLNRFVERDYSDDRLPFIDRPRHFPKSDTGSFFDSFFDTQWRFCPVRFVKNPINLQIEPEQIIPLKRKERLYSDANCVIYRVKLHEEYDSFTEIPTTFDIDLGSTKPSSHTYLFKEFHGKAAKVVYDKELAAFLFLQKSGKLLGKTIVGFHGSFVHDDMYTLILEDPDRGTLNDFMNTSAPPLTGEDVTRMWEELLKLHEALHNIHNISAPYAPEVNQHTLLRGWHQNLNPQTIMVKDGPVKSDYDFEFRILDIGVLSEGQTEDRYVAPECVTSDSQDTNYQMADIWSLGCVFSEFAVWITLGPTGLKDYRAACKAECREAGSTIVGAFHDGQNVLQSVGIWHDHAINCKLTDDRVTEAILNQLVEEMLCEDGDARPNARQLKMKINKILGRAREQHLADLKRYDSVASNSTGYSSLGLSSRGHLSHRASVRSDTSTDSALNHSSSITGRMERPGTLRSALTQRDSLGSPNTIDEQRVVSFSSQGSSSMASPISPLPIQRLSSTVSDIRQMPGAIQELGGDEIFVPKPLRFGNRNSVLDASTLNGDDKEIVISRGPPPVNLVRQQTFETIRQETTGHQCEPLLQSPQMSYSTEALKPPAIQESATSGVADTALNPKAPVSGATLPFIEIRPDNDPRGPSILDPPIQTPDRNDINVQEVDLRRSLTTPGGQIPVGLSERKSIDLRRSVSSPSGPKPTAAENVSLSPLQPTKSSVTVYKPYLNLIDGLIWLNQKKGSASSATINDEMYLNALADRDFVFLIDDSASMRAHREMTSRAVRLLSWLLKKYDKNGMDLYFMQKNDKTHARPGHSSDLQRPLLKTLDSCTGRSDINVRLTQILQEYRDRNAVGTGATPQKTSRASISSIGSSGKSTIGAKKIMIFVITDGKWDAGTEERLKGNMTTFGATMAMQGAPEKAVGLQLIYTEPKEEVKSRLRTLRKGDYSERIAIDSEYLEGNVFRLLLGPISDLWDDEVDQVA